MQAKKQRGYVLLLAVLISSIILAMSMGVFAISIKEVALATFARDSVRAFAAASRGLECAVFLDRINSQAAQDLGLAANYYSSAGISQMPYTPFARGNSTQFGLLTPSESWPMSTSTTDFKCAGNPYVKNYTTTVTATTTGSSSFSLDLPSSCVQVTVAKSGILTTFTANGYSDVCGNITSPRVTQRTIEVSVNI
ncbi:MAG TPA: hypothetical protein VJ579_01095 [Candidatus Paceibacterota bacterium]|nr:hypothetical protein [Candidatus Paceibacterota bacterium]